MAKSYPDITDPGYRDPESELWWVPASKGQKGDSSLGIKDRPGHGGFQSPGYGTFDWVEEDAQHQADLRAAAISNAYKAADAVQGGVYGLQAGQRAAQEQYTRGASQALASAYGQVGGMGYGGGRLAATQGMVADLGNQRAAMEAQYAQQIAQQQMDAYLSQVEAANYERSFGSRGEMMQNKMLEYQNYYGALIQAGYNHHDAVVLAQDRLSAEPDVDVRNAVGLRLSLYASQASQRQLDYYDEVGTQAGLTLAGGLLGLATNAASRG